MVANRATTALTAVTTAIVAVTSRVATRDLIGPRTLTDFARV